MIDRNRLPRSGMALCVFLNGFALALASPVSMAQDKAQPSSGLMQFPNVRVERLAPAPATREPRVAVKSQGVRAFKDPVTGQLRDQTPEEMAAEAFTQLPDGIGSTPATAAMGGIMIDLDESAMSNAVITRDASGKVRMQCVMGHDHAIDAALGKSKSTKGHRHDR